MGFRKKPSLISLCAFKNNSRESGPCCLFRKLRGFRLCRFHAIVLTPPFFFLSLHVLACNERDRRQTFRCLRLWQVWHNRWAWIFKDHDRLLWSNFLSCHYLLSTSPLYFPLRSSHHGNVAWIRSSRQSVVQSCGAPFSGSHQQGSVVGWNVWLGHISWRLAPHNLEWTTRSILRHSMLTGLLLIIADILGVVFFFSVFPVVFDRSVFPFFTAGPDTCCWRGVLVIFVVCFILSSIAVLLASTGFTKQLLLPRCYPTFRSYRMKRRLRRQTRTLFFITAS